MCDQRDSAMYRALLSKAISGPSFNFIPCMEIKISGRCAHPSSKPFINTELNVLTLSAYLKIREINNIKCQNLVILSFKIKMKHKFSLSIK